MYSGKKIGLALSGGGIRACIFHLGVFKCLAEQGLLKQVASLSSVSGASLCVALIFSIAGNRWPTDEMFLSFVLPEIRRRILANDIQAAALLRLPFQPWYWFNRVKLVARMMEAKWGVEGVLQDLPNQPYWEINCTTFETGKNFRIRKDYMGDRILGYAQRPNLRIADMAAASAGFPVLIGPYRLDMRRYMWSEDKAGRTPLPMTRQRCSLWDGGVYDNLGLEALFKIGRGLDAEIDFLIVSNASGESGTVERMFFRPLRNLRRMLDIALDQVASLRTRDVMASVVEKGDGVYVQIGRTAAEIAKASGAPTELAEKLTRECMTEAQAQKARHYPTTLRTPSAGDFDLILRHGYENARCSFACYMKPMRVHSHVFHISGT